MASQVRSELPSDAVIAWKPQKGPQEALLALPDDINECFFGGARGGGKTDGMLGEWAQHAAQYGKNAVGVFFRKTSTQLDETWERAKEIYTLIGGVPREHKKTIIMPGGGRLKFRHLERDNDAELYQGHSYTRLYMEELTNWADQKPVNKLRATLRSANGVPCKFMATGNPGGPGHQWVKARYIDPDPSGYKMIVEDMEVTVPTESGELQKQNVRFTRVFIPSKLQNNPLMFQRDANYVANLKQSGSEQLVRAWLDGDWDVIDGAYFDEWRGIRHVIQPFVPPSNWDSFLSFDWGSAKPFSVGRWVVSDGTFKHPMLPFYFPRGALIRTHEWYGAATDANGVRLPDVGLKMKAEDVGRGIWERFRTKKVIADPAIFIEDGGESIAERMTKASNYELIFAPADNKRIPGWDQVRSRLQGDEDGRPMIYFFSTCTDSIRTIPSLQHDERKPEDLNTSAEDHAADEVRYACTSRPYVRKPPPAPAKLPSVQDITLNQAWNSQTLATGPRNRI
jgi:hypothetical protein